MKKIAEHLGEIIIGLAGVALLISAVTLFSAPVGDFFNGIVEKEVALGSQIMEGIGNIDTSVGVGGSGSGSGGGAGEENGGEAGDEGLTAADLDYLYEYSSYYDGDKDIYGDRAELTADFKAALNNNTDYVVDGKTLWTAGSALPNYQLNDGNMVTINDLAYMFENCSMTTLDLSNWDFSNVTIMDSMFKGCDNLTSIIVRTAADKAKIEASSNFPSGCVVTVK